MRKRFGQNFLVNRNAREKLIDALGFSAGDDVWEVGPGLGAMTYGLLERGAWVKAFEIDEGFITVLKRFFGGDGLFSLVEGDALKTWPLNDNQAEYFLGNLPYSIAAELLGSFIEKKRFFKRMAVTVQKEIGQRLCAKPSTSEYSSFTVLCASSYTVKPLMRLKPASFYPAPHVDSQALVLEQRADADTSNIPPLLYPMVRHLFSFRRKTVKKSLQSFIFSRYGRGASDYAGPSVLDILSNCGINKEERPENIDIAGFSVLAAALEQILE
jgi:16S rRNA (adenine1518-N6/adenine1519-N6)-dimethyltransferase